MAQSSPENLLNFDSWMFKSSSLSSSLLGDSWMISEAFARDTDDVLTKALQKSLYSNNNDAYYSSHDNEINEHNLLIDSMNSPFLNFVSNPNPAVSSLSGGSDDSGGAAATNNNNNNNNNVGAVVHNQRRNHQNVPMINNSFRGGGKITKRKSRASDRHKTTFINADPENFRQLVQEITGVNFGTVGNINVPSSMGGILKPEAQRLTNRSCLPTTLDSSSFLLDRYRQTSVSPCTSSPVGGGAGHVSYTSPPLTVGDGGGGVGLGYDSLSSFPTLESWKVIKGLN